MTRKALMFITTSYPDEGDGSEAAGAFVAELAAEIARICPVRVLSPGRLAGAESESDGVRVRRFASPGRPLSLLSPFRPADWPAIAVTLRSLRQEALELAADGCVAHTVAFWVLPSGWAAAAVKRNLGVPYSVWALGSDIWSLGRLPGVRFLLARVARGAHARWADGIALGDDARRITGVAFPFLPSTRADYEPRPCMRPGGARRRLLFLGRWHPNKGVDLLLESLQQLSEQDWARIDGVTIAGGGPLEPVVRAGVARLQAAGRPVSATGFLGSSAARDALAQTDLLLVPSRIESVPLVFSDGVRAGCAIVASPVGDLPALVSGDDPCGIVATGVSPEAFAAAITAALSTPMEHFRTGIERQAAEFSLKNVARIIAALPGAGRE